MIILRRGALYGYPQKTDDTKGYPQGSTPDDTKGYPQGSTPTEAS